MVGGKREERARGMVNRWAERGKGRKRVGCDEKWDGERMGRT
jgi:hypothetical protein